jgi:hypothetical protein
MRDVGHVKLRHLAGLLLLAVTMGTALPAAHAQYPPTVGNGRVTRSELKKCQCTQFTGDGFQPGTEVTIVDKDPAGIEHVVGTATADNKGGFKIKVCFDEQAAQGDHTLIARGAAPGGGAHEDRATVHVEGTNCFGKGDEIHNPNAVGSVDEEQPRNDGSGATGSGSGPAVGGVGLPRTGADYVLPGLLVGFLLVVSGTAVVHLTRRRRLVLG